MNVCLVGYRGSGKTSVGKLLATRLWQKFVDIDAMIVEKAGKSIKKIFEEDGEERFRDIETVCLVEALAVPDHILALGGGSLNREGNRKLIKDSGGKVIYLKCDPKELHRRVQWDTKSAEHRPNLTTIGGLEEIKIMVTEREPFYREVMTAELEVTNLSVEEIVMYIARML